MRLRTRIAVVLLFGVISVTAVTLWLTRGETNNDWPTFHYWNLRFADAGTARPLFRVRVNGREGFMDRDGHIAIEPKFDKVYPFTEGLSAAMKLEKWGYIDETGEWVIPPTYEMAGLFCEGRAPVRVRFADPYGYIDRTGALVIPPKFDSVSNFVDGVARVGIQTTLSKVKCNFLDVGLDCRYSYIDRNGNSVSKPALTNPSASPTHPLSPI